MLIKPPEETGLYLIKPEELEKYWKQKKLLIKLPEKARQFVIKLPEVCWRSARGVVDWIVAAPSTYKGWLLEVCQRLYL